MLRSTRLPTQCKLIAAQSQIATKKAVAQRNVDALAIPKLIAVIGMTKPITAKATATLFAAIASSFVCSL
ncbi:hypothetical protein MKK63_07680 [Methylobacterium sp. J-088]|uniref:hypothetical protein n=1 Tax=unclassified Methylobacterium TaxID=2615210 RepID=UPI001FB91F09|nr:MULTISPECIES: hypothetical protein [unclassified Methylobacterium]MCJ2062585.1 hypothetical protein [Methylobacterium sp. J-088]